LILENSKLNMKLCQKSLIGKPGGNFGNVFLCISHHKNFISYIFHKLYRTYALEVGNQIQDHHGLNLHLRHLTVLCDYFSVQMRKSDPYLYQYNFNKNKQINFL